MATKSYRDIAAIARNRRDTNIAAYYQMKPVDESRLPNNLTKYSLESGLYTTDELEIIQCEVEDILEKIRDRVWTSLEVAKAFCKAAVVAQSLVSYSIPTRNLPAHSRIDELRDRGTLRRSRRTSKILGRVSGQEWAYDWSSAWLAHFVERLLHHRTPSVVDWHVCIRQRAARKRHSNRDYVEELGSGLLCEDERSHRHDDGKVLCFILCCD